MFPGNASPAVFEMESWPDSSAEQASLEIIVAGQPRCPQLAAAWELMLEHNARLLSLQALISRGRELLQKAMKNQVSSTWLSLSRVQRTADQCRASARCSQSPSC